MRDERGEEEPLLRQLSDAREIESMWIDTPTGVLHVPPEELIGHRVDVQVPRPGSGDVLVAREPCEVELGRTGAAELTPVDEDDPTVTQPEVSELRVPVQECRRHHGLHLTAQCLRVVEDGEDGVGDVVGDAFTEVVPSAEQHCAEWAAVWAAVGAMERRSGEAMAIGWRAQSHHVAALERPMQRRQSAEHIVDGLGCQPTARGSRNGPTSCMTTHVMLVLASDIDHGMVDDRRGHGRGHPPPTSTEPDQHPRKPG